MRHVPAVWVLPEGYRLLARIEDDRQLVRTDSSQPRCVCWSADDDSFRWEATRARQVKLVRARCLNVAADAAPATQQLRKGHRLDWVGESVRRTTVGHRLARLETPRSAPGERLRSKESWLGWRSDGRRLRQGRSRRAPEMIGCSATVDFSRSSSRQTVDLADTGDMKVLFDLLDTEVNIIRSGCVRLEQEPYLNLVASNPMGQAKRSDKACLSEVCLH